MSDDRYATKGWWTSNEWTEEHARVAKKPMKHIRVLPPDWEEDVIHDVALEYPQSIKTWRGINPEGWLYRLLYNRAIEVRDKETAIRGRDRKKNRPKYFASIDETMPPFVVSPRCVGPAMADFLLKPEHALNVIDSKTCERPNCRRLVIRAALDDQRLSDAQLRRAAKHCVECNLCLDLHVYFRTGRILDSDFQGQREWMYRNFTGAEMLLLARAVEESCQRRRSQRFDLLYLYFMKEMAATLRADAGEPETFLSYSRENLRSIYQRLARDVELKKKLWRARERECKELERLYALDSGPESGPGRRPKVQAA